MKQTEGYLIVEKPFVISEWYQSRFESDPRYSDHVQEIRAANPIIDPGKYRGINRNPLMQLGTVDLDQYIASMNSHPSLNADNLDARHRLTEIVSKSPRTSKELDHLDTIEQAIEVYNLIESSQKNKYEIIRFTRHVEPLSINTLGLDIGVWGNDYSILCDSVITPVWHPVPIESINEISLLLNDLNDNNLFSNHKSAESFLNYYLTQEWAEQQSTDSESKYEVMLIDEISTT